jgi:hypothetical protein
LLAWVALLAGAAGCASAVAPGPAAGSLAAGPAAPARGTRPVTATATTALLAGSRCQGDRCICRKGSGKADNAESPPPDADHKRFEIRLGTEGGDVTLDAPAIGRFSTGGPAEACFYVDVLPGTKQPVTFTAHEGRPGDGLSPTLRIAEYGPKGPFWYDVVEVHCRGATGRCTRDAAEEWGNEAKTRKRGRIDPCGSAVVTHLVWETSGGTGDRDSGLFSDLTVTFEMEIKRFPTQFAPGSTECVPK